MDRITDSHKQSLRFLVKAFRDGTIPEEFVVSRLSGGLAVQASPGRGAAIECPTLTPLTLDILTEEGLLYSKGPNAHGRYTCVITPAGSRAVDQDFAPATDISVQKPPIEITESLARFRNDFPDATRLAFVMMQFGTSAAHNRALAGIRAALDPHGLVALRADDKEYHDDLYFNILTYVYGVRFGIAVFERIEDDAFNPNVSLEVGYMLGLQKSVCFLKDRTLRTLHTDLVGKLYRSFDPQNPEGTIPNELFSWMDQKGFISRQSQVSLGQLVLAERLAREMKRKDLAKRTHSTEEDIKRLETDEPVNIKLIRDVCGVLELDFDSRYRQPKR